MTRVSIIKGESRRNNVRKSLDLISDDVKKGIGTRQVIIKPNFGSSTVQLASTHIDHIRGILDYLKDFYKKKVIVAEAAASDTLEAFKNFGYFRLFEEYDIELIDLNRGLFEMVAIEDFMGKPLMIKVAEILKNQGNYRISSARLKTHDTVVITLSVKNMAIGSVLLPDKVKVHQGIRQINLNIARLAKHVWPDLAVIDGLEGMEGEGPNSGNSIHVGIALASNDPLAADRVACEIMGADASRVGYLNHCVTSALGELDMERIEIVGTPLEKCIKRFRLHSTLEEQYKWK